MAGGIVTPIVLGIDLGTSSLKVLAVDSAGTVRARVRLPYPTMSPEPGAAEQDPAAWWVSLGEGVRQVMTGTGAGVVAIGVTGQMHGLVATDPDAAPLAPAVTWQDRRGAATLPGLLDTLGRPAAIAPGYQAATWHWLATTRPALARETRRLHLPKDWLVHRLTGAHVTDPSDAVGTGWYDAARATWDEAVLDAAGASVDLLPTVVPAGSVAGTVSAHAADATGLATGTPVIVAGGDAAVGAFGAGATDPATPLLMLSTGCQVLQAADAMPARNGWPAATPPGLPGWLRVAATLNGGSAVTWARETLGAPAGEPDPELLVLPWLAGERGEHLPADPTGTVLGLRQRHTRADIARAVIDGVTLAIADAFALAGGDPLGSSPLLVGGGGTRDAAWLASIAATLARPLRVVEEPDLSAWGAARSAATALGWLDPVNERSSWTSPARHVETDADATTSRERLARYQAARRMLAEAAR